VKKINYVIYVLLLATSSTLYATTTETNTDIPVGLWVAVTIFILLLIQGFYAKENAIIDETMDVEEAMVGEIKSTKRMQHYKFAHLVLKDMFFNNSDNVITNILTPKDAIKEFWYDVGKYYCEQFEIAEELDGSSLKVTAKETENTLFIVVSLPEPKEVPEAYFVGMIIPHDRKEKSSYITLEKGEIGSVLCEWTKDVHLNFGEGPEPTLANFQDKLISMGNISAKSWSDSNPVYSGEEWMLALWKWADTYHLSPFVMPRNAEDLERIETLSLDFQDDDNPEYLPKEIGMLKSLQTFVLYDSKVKDLPNEFRNLGNLKYLYLDGNEFEEMPDSLCDLAKLEKISLSYNKLTTLPHCIGKLQHLDTLNLKYNFLEYLPESMSSLKLNYLRLQNNPVKYISTEVQTFLNTTRKEDSACKEPFKVVWKSNSDKIQEYIGQFNIDGFEGSLPFFLSGQELESNDPPLTERNLLMGVLYGLNSADKFPLHANEKILTSLLNTLSKGYGYESAEEMVLDVSEKVRNMNGSRPSLVMLETGHKLVPESLEIIEHILWDLWSEISLSEENRIELLEEIPRRVKELDLSKIHPYSKQLVCYYGLCALIFMHRAKGEEYLENNLVDEYLKNYFYPNVSDELLSKKAVDLMANPEKFQPIDLWSPVTHL